MTRRDSTSSSGAFPRPVRRVEMQAQEEGLSGRRVVGDHLDRAVAEQVGEVAVLMDQCVLIPEVVGRSIGCAGLVGEVVELAAAEAVEVVVSALERAVVRQPAQVPFADQRGAVAGFFEQRRQRGMFGRQADVACGPGERFFQADGQAVLVASGDERDAGGGADGGVGVGLGEADAFGGEVVEDGRAVVWAAVAGEVGEAEVVGHDEDDVRPRARWGRPRFRCEGEGRRSERGEGLAAGEAERLHKAGTLRLW